MAIDFESGDADSIDLGTALTALQNVTGGTVTLWAIPESTALTERFIFLLSHGTSTTASRVVISQLGTLGGSENRAGGRRLDADLFQSADGGGAVAGTLVHLAARLAYNGTQLQLFINGALTTTTNIAGWTGSSSNTSSDAAAIGSQPGGANPYDGVIDDVRVYNRALSAEEINEIYQSRGRDTVISGLVHKWLMNEGTAGATATGAASIKDMGPGLRDGTPDNTPIYDESIVVSRRRRK